MRQFTIHESKPEIFYVFNVLVNLHNRKLFSRQVTLDKEALIQEIPMTNTSKFVFPDTDTGEGFIQVWYIVLENNRSFLYAVGTINSSPINCGGYFGEIEKNEINQNVINKYINSHLEHWTDLYSKKEVVALINEMNNLQGNIQKLM